MQIEVGKLTEINQTRVAHGLPDMALNEANRLIVNLPDGSDIDFLYSCDKHQVPAPAPEAPKAKKVEAKPEDNGKPKGHTTHMKAESGQHGVKTKGSKSE